MYRGSTPANDRLEAYKAKVRAFAGTGSPPDYTPAVIQGKLALMYRKFARAAGEQATYQNQVSTILALDGTESRIKRPFYQAFAGQMYKLCLSATSGDAALEASILITKWMARGLSQGILQKIRSNVFGVSAPIAP
jgi:hypothetical protein